MFSRFPAVAMMVIPFPCLALDFLNEALRMESVLHGDQRALRDHGGGI